MRLSEIYQGALDAIEQRGWIQAGFTEDPWGEGGGPVCIEGAIMAAAGITDYRKVGTCPAYADMKDYLGLGNGRMLFQWNDRMERTREEVVAALEGARDRALEREGLERVNAELQMEFEELRELVPVA